MTLRRGTSEDIIKMFEALKSDSRNIQKRVWQLVYFMRGALQYHDAMSLSYLERELCEEMVSDRLEIESKKMSPNY